MRNLPKITQQQRSEARLKTSKTVFFPRPWQPKNNGLFLVPPPSVQTAVDCGGGSGRKEM